MTIEKKDIKLFESERLEDTTDSGGKITGTVIVSGQENNIFSDISRINRVYGNISLRKVFVGVDTQETEHYFGSHCILSENPIDSSVAMTLFTTKNWDDQRSSAKDYVERYLSKGSKWIGFLFEKQLIGQKALTVWQRPSIPLPEIGSVWVLVQNEGLLTQYEQYVRISKITDKLQTFIDLKGEYVVRLLTIEISDPLLFDFEGVAPKREDTDLVPKATIRNTLPVDAAKYYGTKKLAQNSQIGEMTVIANSIYSQLVPSSQSEIGVVDNAASGSSISVIPSGKANISFTTGVNISANIGFYLGAACKQSSLAITVSGGTLTDDGGDIKLNGTNTVGTIDYTNGLIQFNSTCPTYTGTKTVSFFPAAPLNKLSDSASIAILPQNRGYVHSINLFPIPAPGTLRIDYLSQGKWYSLWDRGNGTLKGLNSSFGSAQVNYTTGSVIVTLGALPDNGSDIMFFWSTKVSTFNRSSAVPPTVKIEYALENKAIAPNTFSATFNGKSLSDNGLGILSGTGGTGTINYAMGKVSILPSNLPLGGTTITNNYSYGSALLKEFAHPARNVNGKIPLQTDLPNVLPHSVELEYNCLIDDYEAYVGKSSSFTISRANWVDPIVTVRDNGQGQFIRDGQVIATINYASGAIELSPELIVLIPKPIFSNHPIGTETRQPTPQVTETITTYRYLFDGWEYIQAPAKFPIDETGFVKVRYRAADSPQAITENYNMSSLKFDLTDKFLEQIIGGSVRFTLSGRVYFDRDGILYHSLNAANGSATQGGAIDYTTGIVTISDWITNGSNTLTIESLLTYIQEQSVDRVVFRTPRAPIRPGSLSIRANQLNGTLISASAGMDSKIDTEAMSGTVDYETGIVRIRFGQWVNPQGYQNEPWYLVNAIRADGLIFKPIPVDPASIKFNCVIYTYLPLDASILGLDPVRLPFDGKVPIFQKSDVVVIHSTENVMCPNPLNAGYQVNCQRVRLARIEVRDINGKVLDPEKYIENLDDGLVTFKTPLDLTGYVQPMKVYHTVEDMAQVTDVEISGRISLNKPLSYNFNASNSYISSAVIFGDLFARWTNPFSQNAMSEWKDTIIGAPIIAQYNYTQNPIVVNNRGTIQQRWALIFTTTTTFRIVGETLGQIGTGDINSICSPINPNSGAPYFTLNVAGWGSGWSAGVVLRFNTIAAQYPIWLARTVLQSTSNVQKDNFRLLIRGDIDN